MKGARLIWFCLLMATLFIVGSPLSAEEDATTKASKNKAAGEKQDKVVEYGLEWLADFGLQLGIYEQNDSGAAPSSSRSMKAITDEQPWFLNNMQLRKRWSGNVIDLQLKSLPFNREAHLRYQNAEHVNAQVYYRLQRTFLELPELNLAAVNYDRERTTVGGLLDFLGGASGRFSGGVGYEKQEVDHHRQTGFTQWGDTALIDYHGKNDYQKIFGYFTIKPTKSSTVTIKHKEFDSSADDFGNLNEDGFEGNNPDDQVRFSLYTMERWREGEGSQSSLHYRIRTDRMEIVASYLHRQEESRLKGERFYEGSDPAGQDFIQNSTFNDSSKTTLDQVNLQGNLNTSFGGVFSVYARGKSYTSDGVNLEDRFEQLFIPFRIIEEFDRLSEMDAARLGLGWKHQLSKVFGYEVGVEYFTRDIVYTWEDRDGIFDLKQSGFGGRAALNFQIPFGKAKDKKGNDRQRPLFFASLEGTINNRNNAFSGYSPEDQHRVSLNLGVKHQGFKVQVGASDESQTANLATGEITHKNQYLSVGAGYENPSKKLKINVRRDISTNKSDFVGSTIDPATGQALLPPWDYKFEGTRDHFNVTYKPNNWQFGLAADLLDNKVESNLEGLRPGDGYIIAPVVTFTPKKWRKTSFSAHAYDSKRIYPSIDGNGYEQNDQGLTLRVNFTSNNTLKRERAPLPIKNLTATQKKSRRRGMKVALTWEAPAEAEARGVKSYKIYRSENDKVELTEENELDTAYTTDYSDSRAKKGHIYTYAVVSENAYAISDPLTTMVVVGEKKEEAKTTAEASATAQGELAAAAEIAEQVTGDTALATDQPRRRRLKLPYRFSARNAKDTECAVKLRWRPRRVNLKRGLTGYYLYRLQNRRAKLSEEVLVGSFAAEPGEYTDKEVSCGKTYYYRLVAFVEKGKQTFYSNPAKEKVRVR